ncbi:hypothetical protein KFE25_007105 [Diacronema lutheri]|uniref:Uncharacterized protein n=2 Tax=Diacronema lutheri TaxID=2081491 RepID=A0A8J6CHS4_DIALT|nr:hypothetical protein KFE25_007105 [Diacronema lutheri]
MATRTARRRRGAEGVTGDTAASPPTRCATEEDLADTCRSPLLAKLGTIKEAILLHGKHAEARVYVGILSGYRLHDLTFRQSLRSLFQWHNETLNVWTHLTGFVLFVCLLVYTAKLAGAARLPEPLVECAHAVERAACLRTLALSTLSGSELARISRSLAVLPASAAALPSRTLAALLGDVARTAVEQQPSARHDDRLHRALRHLAAVRLPAFHVSLPRWLGARGKPDARRPDAPAVARLSLADRMRAAVFGREGGLRGVALPQLRLLLNATALGLHRTADSLELGLNMTRDAAARGVHAAMRGEAFLHGAAADISAQLPLLKLSAIVASLPNVPELAALQREANHVLSTFSEALHLPTLEALSPPTIERWPIYFFLASAMVCLAGSAVYHLFGTANARWAGLLGTLDFIGITALIVGSFVPILFYGFYEHRFLRTLYIALICALGGVLFVLALTPLFHLQRYRELRTMLFTGLGLSGVVPITHMLVYYDFNQLSRFVLVGTLLTGGAYLCGTAFYLSRFPEVLAPGRFDFALSSHNIWHVMVVLAASLHFSFVLELWQERSVAAGPLTNATLATAMAHRA